MPDENDKKLVRTRPAAGGADFVRTPEDAAALADLGEAQLSTAQLGAIGAEEGMARRREAFDTAGDKALTFVEGIVDALSVGLIHETGPAADLRREVNSPYGTGGNLLGTALGLFLPGPIRTVTNVGREAGESAAKAVIGEVQAGSRGALAVKTAGGAGEMAALMAGASVGHQVTDAVLGDKDFSATAVLHEAGLGAVLGGTVSFLSGVFSRGASKYDTQAMDDIVNPNSAQSRSAVEHVENAIRKLDDALTTHEGRMGALQQLRKDGTLDEFMTVWPEFMAEREIALAKAQGFRKDLSKIDFETAFRGNEKEMAKYLKAQQGFELAVKDLDELMHQRVLERMRSTRPGKPMEDPGRPVTENLGLDMEEVARMDDLMKNPENAAAYEQLYGRPYQPQAQYADDVVRGGTPRPGSESGTPMQRPGKAAREPFDPQRLPLQAEDPALASAEAAPLPKQPLPGRMSLEGYHPTGPAVLRDPPPAVQAGALPIRAPGGYEVTGYKGAAPGLTSRGYEAVGYGGRASGIAPAGMAPKGAPKGAPMSAPMTPVQVAEAAAQVEAKVAQAVEKYTPPSLPGPGERFNPAEWTPARVLGESGAQPGGKVVALTDEAALLENELSGAYPELARTQFLRNDGFFQTRAMTVDARQNAEAFAQFRAAAQPTPVGSSRPTPVITDNLPLPPRPPAGERIPTPVEVTDVAPVDGVTRVTGRERLRRGVEAQQRDQGKAAVQRYIDEWAAQSEALGPRYSPADYAAQEIRRTIDELSRMAGGRDLAAASTDLAHKLGLADVRTSLATQVRDLYLVRRVAETAAAASKGTVMSGASGASRNSLMDWIIQRSMGRIAGQTGRKMVGGAIGGAVGGPLGFFMGVGLASQVFGFAGRASGAVGRLYQRTIKAADSLLKGRRATYVAAAVAPNKPIAYSEAGPIKDPVKRIEELRRVASSPGTLADFIAKAAGDLNIISPAFVAAAVNQITAQMAFLSEMAPPLRYDQLGRPVPPSAGEIRKFLEAENAVFNLDGLLSSVARGSVTEVQVEALRRAHGPVYSKIAAFLMDDPAKLERLDRAKLKTVEMVLGVGLTPSSDPEFVMRQQASWAPPQVPGQTVGGPTQALKIPGAGGPPSDRGARSLGASPTPSQSYGTTGRAPGN